MKTDAKTTIQDISVKAGVSPSTVSRVLTGSAPVSEAKREIIEATIRQLNYKPNFLARSLRTKKTFSLGLLLNDITNPFYSHIARGIEDDAIHQGYSLILCNTNEDPQRELHYLKVLQDKQVDGIILGPTTGNSAFIRELAGQIPIVLVDRPLAGAAISTVIVDNESSAHQATQYLLDKGHHRIALVSWQQDIFTQRQRRAGYQRALVEAGLPLNPADVILVPRLNSEMAADLTGQFLRCKPAPTAIFALNNQLGLGVLSAIHALKLKIPDDISLIIFDDLPIFSLHTPPISVIAQPAFEIGQQAIQLLLHQIKDPDNYTPETVVLPTQLMIRESA